MVLSVGRVLYYSAFVLLTLVEIAIIALWLGLVTASVLRRRGPAWDQLTLVLVASLTSLAGELVNEVVFAEFGAHWGDVLWVFPGYQFPVAVLLGAGLYAFFLNTGVIAVARLRAVAGLSTPARAVALVGVYLLLSTACWAMEYTFTAIGYWTLPLDAAPFRAILIGSYVYYFLIATPAVVAARIVARCVAPHRSSGVAH